MFIFAIFITIRKQAALEPHACTVRHVVVVNLIQSSGVCGGGGCSGNLIKSKIIFNFNYLVIKIIINSAAFIVIIFIVKYFNHFVLFS